MNIEKPLSDWNEKTILLEQYKLYVEMADRVSSRRIEANKYYSTILTGIFAALSFIIEKSSFQSNTENILLFGAALLSLCTCVLWFINIRSYSLLNSSKFDVIHEIEKKLPFAGYELEWHILNNKFVQLTNIERLMPLVFSLIYLVLLLHTVFNILK